MSSAQEILKQVWGYDAFRPQQEAIVNAVLQGKDTLALLPTGGGKSICYQVPALVLPGICLVVSPLIALMKDQVENLKSRGVSAQYLHGGMSRSEIELELESAVNGKYKLLYVSPERLKSELLFERLPYLNISLLAVDEAHCISQWGFDFRPEYLEIYKAREKIGAVPMMALTATATPKVIEDISAYLKFSTDFKIFKKSFLRTNLKLGVVVTEDKNKWVKYLCEKWEGTGIVYVRNRKMTQTIATILQAQKISADFYHAGLDNSQRNQKQEAWQHNRTRIMVCTNAFGMGIDKPDVRFVIHVEPPDGLESYYQEVGRGGRDGKDSQCALLYHPLDKIKAEENFNLRYPPIVFVKKVYQALGNYSNVAFNTGKGISVPFSLNELCERFELPYRKTFYALKNLEQIGKIRLSEGLKEPSKIRITVSSREIYEFQLKHTQYDKLITALLRLYGGLYDRYVSVQEKKLSEYLKTPQHKIEQQLNKLNSWVLDYKPAHEGDFIIFTENREPSPRIDAKLLNQLRESAWFRYKKLYFFVESKVLCRNQTLLNYFGEKLKQPCGICDHCKKPDEKRIDSLQKQVAWVVDQLKEPKSTADLINIASFEESDTLEAIKWAADQDFIRSEDQVHWEKRK